jgi:sugar O-acyltransferase (sialic acid O-acetyltransferase NeuD family)
MANKIYIIGCGGHARSVADVILGNNPGAQLVFIDENAAENETISGFPVIKSLEREADCLFVAIGDNQQRRKLAEGKKLISVISHKADVSPTAIIEEGCFIGNGAHIGPFAHIGKGTIVNTNSVIEHEVETGSFCHFAPNTTVCGRTIVGSNVFLGAGATVIDKRRICPDVVIGAGATVVKDIEKNGIYAGVPAVLKKEFNSNEMV